MTNFTSLLIPSAPVAAPGSPQALPTPSTDDVYLPLKLDMLRKLNIARRTGEIPKVDHV